MFRFFFAPYQTNDQSREQASPSFFFFFLNAWRKSRIVSFSLSVKRMSYIGLSIFGVIEKSCNWNLFNMNMFEVRFDWINSKSNRKPFLSAISLNFVRNAFSVTWLHFGLETSFRLRNSIDCFECSRSLGKNLKK